jgi:hypothetical protein
MRPSVAEVTRLAYATNDESGEAGLRETTNYDSSATSSGVRCAGGVCRGVGFCQVREFAGKEGEPLVNADRLAADHHSAHPGRHIRSALA